MMQMAHHIRSATARLKRLFLDFGDESGSTTIEFLLWVPIFMFIIMITVDVSLLFLRQSNLWKVARDTARQVSYRQLSTVGSGETSTPTNPYAPDSKAEAYARANGTFSGDTPTIAKVVIATDVDGIDSVQVQLSVPMSEVGVFSVFKIGGRIMSVGQDGNLTAVVILRMEPI